jgi:hypothetical protein
MKITLNKIMITFYVIISATLMLSSCKKEPKLRKIQYIKGYVKDKNGAPKIGLLLEVQMIKYRSIFGGGKTERKIVGSGTTDSNGFFLFQFNDYYESDQYLLKPWYYSFDLGINDTADIGTIQ